jgi:hypothetical protein
MAKELGIDIIGIGGPNKSLIVRNGSTLVLGTTVPATPPAGFIALYTDGTDILAMNSAGATVTLTTMSGAAQTWV